MLRGVYWSLFSMAYTSINSAAIYHHMLFDSRGGLVHVSSKSLNVSYGSAKR